MVLKPLKVEYSIPIRRTKTGFDPSHGSSSETQTFALDEHTAALDPKTSQMVMGFDAKDCGTPSVDDFDDYP